jgi:hypothetical protein
MLSEIYNIISMFVLLHPILTVYLAGSLIAVGIVYSLISGGYLNPPNKKRMFITAIGSSWIVVIVFLYGFFSFLFKNNEGGE